MSKNRAVWDNLALLFNRSFNGNVSGHKHFLEFTNCRFHNWVLKRTIDNKTPEFVKQLLNVWYEVYTRFFKA